MTPQEKLASLRSIFHSPKVFDATGGRPLSAYFVKNTDAHNSEYISEADARIRFLSGFSGSSAEVVVTSTQALLWTDSRYFIQAEKQMSSDWTLMKSKLPDSIYPSEWLSSNLNRDEVVGFDPNLLSYDEARNTIKKLEKMGVKMVPIRGNLIEEIWNDRPLRQKKKLLTLTDCETGEGIASKIDRIRGKLEKKKCSAGIFGTLDDVMWTLNVRGFDIPYNPFAHSFLFISAQETHFFIDENKIDEQIRSHLENVVVHPYGSVIHWMQEYHGEHKNDEGYRVFVADGTNYAIGSIFEESSIVDASVIQLMKDVKNWAELQGMRESHIRDSAALVEFFFWMENELKSGMSFTETQLACKINRIRSNYQNFVDLSFETISAGGEHAALPHYTPKGAEGQRMVGADDVFLLDSGAQYRDGTTDVTRTIVVNGENAPEEFKKHNTAVLKGHIFYANTVFPEGTEAIRIDSLARLSLWQQGLNYGHGTGHGFGHFLSVHEGPSAKRKFSAGMTVTIEPGFYLEGKWGIRIENCYETVVAAVPSGATGYVKFEPLTFVPIQTSIIQKDLLTQDEIVYLNNYHDRVLSVTGEILKKQGKEDVYLWLQKQCRHI